MNNKKRAIKSVIFLFLLIIMIILISKINFGYIGPIPTGNVDIFNIECDKEDNTCDCINSNNQQNNNETTNNDETSNPVFNEKKSDLTVYDKETKWNANTRLRIFSNPAYEFKNVISPGTNNAYQFVINNNNLPITYKIKFTETNPYKINMRYKLKRNGEYIYGNDKNWVKAEEIERDGLNLPNNSHDTYTLIWKWLDDDNVDTIAGFDLAEYKLFINIKASSI